MIKFSAVALICTCVVGVALATPKNYEKETEVSVSSNSKFTISAGWTFDSQSKKLTSPEGDLIAYLIEKKAESDLDALSLKAWKEINPQFNFPVQQKVSPPAKDGWEAVTHKYYKRPFRLRPLLSSSPAGPFFPRNC